MLSVGSVNYVIISVLYSMLIHVKRRTCRHSLVPIPVCIGGRTAQESRPHAVLAETIKGILRQLLAAQLPICCPPGGVHYELPLGFLPPFGGFVMLQPGTHHLHLFPSTAVR